MSDKPHHLGHRQRLRERFLKAGVAGLADYELLELVLFGAIPRGDVKPLAKRLMDRFGGFAGVISAEPERLAEVDGLGTASIAQLKAVAAAAQRLAQAEIENRPTLSSHAGLVDYCNATMARAEREEFRVFFLDRRNHMIADEVQQRGTIDHTPVYPREVVKRALDLGATALILAHNHPSGDPTPSRADIEMTQKLVDVADSLGIVIHDHIIIGRGGHASFRSLGLL